MKKFIRVLLREAISASEAYDVMSSIQTIVDGKRNVGFVQLDKNEINYIHSTGLKLIKVPSNKYDSYIIFKSGYESDAKELLNIAEKYGGYLSYNATPEDSRRIGQLLNYNDSDIEDYIQKNQEGKSESISENNEKLKSICNRMSVATWEEGYKLLIGAIGTPEQNPKIWDEIKLPINNWIAANKTINNQIKTYNMSGDSMVDESNTWWATIQSTICR